MSEHPGRLLAEYLEQDGYTQKAFSLKIGKKVSEINELIKGKRNITIAWDILLSQIFFTAPKFWIFKQLDYDYEQALFAQEKKLNVVDDQLSSFSKTLSSEVSADLEFGVEQGVPGEEKHPAPQVSQEFAITKVFEAF